METYIQTETETQTQTEREKEPAAPSKWPTAPFVDDTPTGSRLYSFAVPSHPKTEAMAAHSRPSPIGVDVACAFT